MRISKSLIFLIICVWFGTFIIILIFFQNPFKLDFGALNPGTLGDSFGIINSFVGVLTLLLVNQTFQLQKEELKATRDEFKEQSKVFKTDLFEKSFYNLLDSLEKIIINFEIEEDVFWSGQKPPMFTGRDGLEKLLNNGITIKGNIASNGVPMTSKNLMDFIKKNSGSASQLNMYLRTLNVIVKLIFDNNIYQNKTDFYIEILNARLGNTEFKLVKLFMNELKKDGQRFAYYELAFPQFGKKI